MDSQQEVLIGVARASRPPLSSVSRLAPAMEISSHELHALREPVVVLGGAPCRHWQSAIRARNDLLYVEVPGTSTVLGCGDVVLSQGHPAAVRRRLSHFLELKQHYGGILPRLSAMGFSWKGIDIPLTPIEVRLLELLHENEGEIVLRHALAVAGGCHDDQSRALDAHVHRLRRKLMIPGVEIRTERQRGFRLLLA